MQFDTKPVSSGDDLLCEQRLGKQGIHVKLERGFEEGVYAAYVEFADLANRIGFQAAHRQAFQFCGLLRMQLADNSQQALGEIEDPTLAGDPRKKHDLELTYLTFPIHTLDGGYHDDSMRTVFNLALLRCMQQWDQRQAGVATKRLDKRTHAFRGDLAELLDGDAYLHLDGNTKERLLEDVTRLAFRSRER